MLKGTAIIIPCYNEGKRLDPNAFKKFLESHKKVHFFFVNDGSVDQTGDVLESIRKIVPERICCLALDKNIGKSAAVRKGFLAAIDEGFDNIGFWDADLATPLDTIIEMTDRLGRPEIIMVIGARVKLLGHEIRRNVMRHYLGRIFASCASLVLRLPVYDTQCGAKIFRNSTELKIAFQEPFSVNWSFDVELLGRLELIRRSMHKSSLAISAVEFPLPQWKHQDGSKIKLKDFFVCFYELTKIFLLLRAPVFKKRYSDLFNSTAPSLT